MLTWLIILVALAATAFFLVFRARTVARLERAPRKPEDTRARAVQDGGQLDFELPPSYDRDRIVTLARDPNWVYAYWELSEAKKRWFESQFGGNSWEVSRSLLRVYDLTASTSENLEESTYFDISINDLTNNWYIYVGKPNHKIQVDLGRLLPDYTFVTLARSNIVVTPGNEVSGLIDPLWPPNELVWQTLTRTGRLVLPSGHTFQLVQKVEPK